MQGLCLHTGANKVEREAVYTTATPEPIRHDSGRMFVPIPHGFLVDTARDALTELGYTVTDEAHALTRDRYFGLLQVNGKVNSHEWSTVVGLRNGHGGDFAAGGVLGSRVFVCDNLAFSGEVKFARSHTRFILRDLPGLVYYAIGRLLERERTQNDRFLSYQRTELSDPMAHSLIVRAVKVRAIGERRILPVLEQWENPAHEDFRPRTLWSLYNAFTEALKPRDGQGTTLRTLPASTMRLQTLLDTVPSS